MSESDQIDRTDLAAERALIGAALHPGSNVYEQENGRLSPIMFSDARMGHVWRAIGSVVDAGLAVDSMTVARHLPDDAGMMVADVSALADDVPSAANASYYADRVLRAYVWGHLMRVLKQIELHAPEVSAETVAGAMEEIGRTSRLSLQGSDRNLPEPLTGEGWNAEVPDREWLIDAWLPAGELVLFPGPGAAGKSLMGLQLGAALACDRKPLQNAGGWLPKGENITATPPQLCDEPVTVALATWEDSRDEALRRRLRLHLYGGCGWIAHPSVNERLHLFPMRGRGPTWLQEETRVGAALRQYCERIDARLLVLDPSSLAFCLDENDRAAVSAALDSWAGWAMDTGCAVLVTAHPPKTKEINYSGSTAWRSLARSMWSITTTKEGKDTTTKEGEEISAELTLDKANYAADGVVLHLRTSGRRAGWNLYDDASPKEPAELTESAKGPKFQPIV